MWGTKQLLRVLLISKACSALRPLPTCPQEESKVSPLLGAGDAAGHREWAAQDR
jgi:hypothetical protein